MATTVRVQDDDKAFLDELQARYLLATGKRISLDELIHKMVELVEARVDELILEDRPPKLTEQEVEAFVSGATDWGVRTSEEDIDRVLYGGRWPA